MPPAGAVWPAIVIFDLPLMSRLDVRLIVPATSNTIVRPLAEAEVMPLRRLPRQCY